MADIIVNKIWLRNPGIINDSQWEALRYTGDWKWNDVKIQVADINGDGRNNIILTPDEPAKQKYRISWFELKIEDNKTNWYEHIIDSNVETVFHSLSAEDFDSDGDIDILTADMNKSEKNGQIFIYTNENNGRRWKKSLISLGGSHNIIAVDIDGDYDIDFFGTN
jgi:hypothetical protein